MATLTGIIVGEYGKSITLTLKKDGTAVDISSYTTNTIEITSSKKKLSKSVSFTTDGTDGKVTFSFDSGELDIDEIWKAQIYLLKTGELSKSNIFSIDVQPSIT